MARFTRHLGALAAVFMAVLIATGSGSIAFPPNSAATASAGSIDEHVLELATSDPAGTVPVLIQRAPGVQDLSAITRHGATVRDQIDFHKARHRLGPVGERFDRHLVLEQRARPSGADTPLGQASP